MDKTPKISENFSTHKPWSVVENPPFYMANSRQRIELESCSNPLWIGKSL